MKLVASSENNVSQRQKNMDTTNTTQEDANKKADWRLQDLKLSVQLFRQAARPVTSDQQDQREPASMLFSGPTELLPGTWVSFQISAKLQDSQDIFTVNL